VNTSKVMFLVVLTIISLFAVNTQPVNSQDVGIIYIATDGSVVTSTNLTVPIQRVGDIYTFTDNIENYYIVVQRDNIVVDGAGYSLAGQGEVGIDLSYRNNVTIENTKIGFAFYAIYLGNASSNTISGNILTYNGYGVYLLEASQNVIIGNNITNNEVGIDIRSSSNNILRNNKLNNNHNLAVYGSEPSHFVNDVDDSNTVNGKKPYYLISESDLTINPSTFPDVGYLALVNCRNITVHDLELTNNGHGIILAYTTESTITQNHMTDNYNGIGLFSSSGNFIVTNTIANNYRGIQLSNASNTNSISANNITDNSDGIFLFDSFQNTIAVNNITNNDIGIGLKESSYSMIRGNYFISNERQVYDVSMDDASVTASMNIWGVGYPLGGNYWSDYTGVDVKSGENQTQTGSDGLGDTPYIIYGNNQDSFPLMPYGSPPAISIVSPENKTYTVNSVSLSFTVSETTSWTKYSLDGQANVTITEDTTLSDLSDGVHSITVYVQDTDGQTGTSETIYFTIAEGSETPTETQQSEAFPITWIAAIIVVVVVVGVVLLYFLKIKKK
jgi:parallel beta-helix repeat protein